MLNSLNGFDGASDQSFINLCWVVLDEENIRAMLLGISLILWDLLLAVFVAVGVRKRRRVHAT